MMNLDDINKRIRNSYKPTVKEMIEGFYEPTVEERIKKLVEEGNIDGAQRLYFEKIVGERANLIRL